ncbi:hypothetical protein EYZ11_010975 [Aspergillus tanneri]|uniref:Uncharacterized protein n=1 Tax=Aspergillus tanneri TaxID=1220188 RepID=A0A4S3J9F5_9EURO|nr:hypothetical protein EYZ11_010975 [Aspergillus tanneri]
MVDSGSAPYLSSNIAVPTSPFTATNNNGRLDYSRVAVPHRGIERGRAVSVFGVPAGAFITK